MRFATLILAFLVLACGHVHGGTETFVGRFKLPSGEVVPNGTYWIYEAAEGHWQGQTYGNIANFTAKGIAVTNGLGTLAAYSSDAQPTGADPDGGDTVFVWKTGHPNSPDLNGGGTGTTHYPNTTRTQYIDFTLGVDMCDTPRTLTFKLLGSIDAAQGEIYDLAVSLRVDGVQKWSMPKQRLSGPVTELTLVASGITTNESAFNYEWLVNGKKVAGSFVSCETEILNNTVIDSVGIDPDILADSDHDGKADVEDTDADGDGFSDDTKPTNAPLDEVKTEPSTPPPPGTPLVPGQGGTGTEPEKEVIVKNTNDFYKPFKAALEEAGKGHEFFPRGSLPSAVAPGVGDGSAGPGEDTGPAESTENIDAFKKAYEDGQKAEGDINEELTKKLVNKMQVKEPGKIGDLGKTSTFNVALPQGIFHRPFFTVDLSPYDSVIQFFRMLCYWCVTVLAWFKMWNYLRQLLTV